MLRLLKKMIVGPVDWFLYTVISEKQKKFLANLFTEKQKNILKKLMRYGTNHTQKKLIHGIKFYLYNFGLEDRALVELKSLYNRTEDPIFKRVIAWELALWHVNKYTKEDAHIALDYLQHAKDGERNSDQLRKIAIIIAECYERIHQPNKGMQVIQEMLTQQEHPDLYLALVNLEETIDKRVKWINQALRSYHIHPIEFTTQTNNVSYDDLQTKEIDKVILTGPKVSVILPAYNAESGIRIAIESILSQTWRKLELLVVDDCSTDDTVKVVEEYLQKDDRIKLFSTPANSGPYVARNIALKEATGEFVTVNDADDWSHAEKIEIQVEHLINNPSVIANTSEHARLTEDLKIYRRGNPGTYIFPNMSSLMFRREPVQEKLGFWDNVRFAGDGEFKRRLIRIFGEQNIVDLKTGPLSLPRQSVNSLTGSSAFGYNGFFMGARKEYVESLEFYHERAEHLYYSLHTEQRSFPVPEPMWPHREEKSNGKRSFDLVIVADFRTILDEYPTFVQEVTRLKTDKKIGLVQMSKYSLSTEGELHPNIRGIIDGENVQVLVYGEKITTDYLFVMDYLVLEDWQRYIPNLDVGDIFVRIDSVPNQRGQLFKEAAHNLEQYFGKSGIWIPANAEIQEFIIHHQGEFNNLHIREEKWENMMSYVE